MTKAVYQDIQREGWKAPQREIEFAGKGDLKAKMTELGISHCFIPARHYGPGDNVSLRNGRLSGFPKSELN